MKKYALLVVVVLLLTPGVALSQGSYGRPQNRGGDTMGQNSPQRRQGGDSAQFQTRKNEILQRLNTRISELQKQEGCVQAANTREALVACMPKHREQRQNNRRPDDQPGNQQSSNQRQDGPQQNEQHW